MVCGLFWLGKRLIATLTVPQFSFGDIMTMQTRDSLLAIAAGLVIGIGSFIFLFGVERAAGLGLAYRWPAGDLAQHIAGAFAYIDGSWSFPIFHTERINAPVGVNIIFTDSAPFAGLIAKIIHSLTGLRFNYLGTWFALSWVGQAVGGAYLLRQLGPQNLLIYACGALLALAWPSFLNRHFHLALASHFLLLLALGLYLPTSRSGIPAWRSMIWAILLGVALWTHAYLLVMTLALFAAALLDGVFRYAISVKRAAAIFGCTVVFLVLLAFIGGYQTANGINAIGYGSFRLDLLSYVWTHGSALFPSPLIFDMQSGFEGYNYLGIGAFIAVCLGAVFMRPKDMVSLSHYPMLLVTLLGMLAFAIGNYVTFAGQLVWNFPLPIDSVPFSTFRANGRFGWALGYLVVFASLGVLLRALARKNAILPVLAAVLIAGVQIADARILLKGVQDGWRAGPKPIAEAALRTAEIVDFEPALDCLPTGPILNAGIEVLALAARAGKITDSAHTARTVGLDCSKADLQAADNALVISQPGTVAGTFYAERRTCSLESELLICPARQN